MKNLQNVQINNETGEKIYIKNDIKNKQLISIKDEETGKENLIDKETGEKEENLEIKINEETKEPYIINKYNGEIINNIVPIINPKTGEEIFISKEILDNKNKEKKNNIKNIQSKKSFEIISKKDKRTGEEILVNKETGIEIDNIEKKYDEKIGENILVNKETGVKIKDIKIKINPKTKTESFIIKYDTYF